MFRILFSQRVHTWLLFFIVWDFLLLLGAQGTPSTPVMCAMEVGLRLVCSVLFTSYNFMLRVLGEHSLVTRISILAPTEFTEITSESVSPRHGGRSGCLRRDLWHRVFSLSIMTLSEKYHTTIFHHNFRNSNRKSHHNRPIRPLHGGSRAKLQFPEHPSDSAALIGNRSRCLRRILRTIWIIRVPNMRSVPILTMINPSLTTVHRMRFLH